MFSGKIVKNRYQDGRKKTESVIGRSLLVSFSQVPFLNFAVVWFGVTNSFWKAVVLGTLSPQFRLAARVLCLTLCCRHRRLPPELLGLDDDD